MDCEMCGAKTQTTRVLIEGAVLNLCARCAKFGKAIPAPPKTISKPAYRSSSGGELRDTKSDDIDILTKLSDGAELIDDYPRVIREARQKLGLTQEQLGQKLNEKKSIIQQLETGGIRPDDKLIKKLEKTLSIRLKEPVEEKKT